MANPTGKKDGVVERVSDVLSYMVSPEYRLIKKHLIDSEGRLRLYHPVTQRTLFDLLAVNGLAANLKEYVEANDDCEE